MAVMPNSVQVASRAGITFRQLDHWVTKGWLHPDGGSGSGNERYWSPSESIVAADMGMLNRFGIPPALAHRIARAGQAQAVATILDQVEKVPL